MNLRPHLRGDAGLLGRLGDDPGFAHAVRERLLAVDVLLPLECRQRGEGVRVLRARNHDGVELAVFQLVVELAEVAALPGLRELLSRRVDAGLVRVAKSDNVLAADGVHVRSAAAATADDDDVQLLTRRPAEQDGWGAEQSSPGESGLLDETSASDRLACARHWQAPWWRMLGCTPC